MSRLMTRPFLLALLVSASVHGVFLISFAFSISLKMPVGNPIKDSPLQAHLVKASAQQSSVQQAKTQTSPPKKRLTQKVSEKEGEPSWGESSDRHSQAHVQIEATEAKTQAKPLSPTSLDEATRAFRFQIGTQMKRFQHYPKIAKERGEAGKVLLEVDFVEGGLWQLHLTASSSYARLDAQAKETLERALLASSVPEKLKPYRFRLSFPIEFRLDNE